MAVLKFIPNSLFGLFTKQRQVAVTSGITRSSSIFKDAFHSKVKEVWTKNNVLVFDLSSGSDTLQLAWVNDQYT